MSERTRPASLGERVQICPLCLPCLGVLLPVAFCVQGHVTGWAHSASVSVPAPPDPSACPTVMVHDVGLHAALVQPVVDNAPLLAVWVGVFFGLQVALDTVVPALAPGLTKWIVENSKKEDYASLRTRVMGTLFALYASGMAGYVLAFEGLDAHEFYAKHPLVLHWLVAPAVGFFTWDVITCTLEGWGLAYFVHGVAVLAVYTAGLYGFLPYMACVCLLYEASTPFLHLRKVMLSFGYAKSHPDAFTAVTLVFALAFFLSRIVVGLSTSAFWWADMLTHLADGTYHSLPVYIMFLACNAVLSGLNIWWFSTMVGVAFKGKEAMEKADAKQK